MVVGEIPKKILSNQELYRCIGLIGQSCLHSCLWIHLCLVLGQKNIQQVTLTNMASFLVMHWPFFLKQLNSLCFMNQTFFLTLIGPCWIRLVFRGPVHTAGAGHDSTLVTDGELVVTGQTHLLERLSHQTAITAHLQYSNIKKKYTNSCIILYYQQGIK